MKKNLFSVALATLLVAGCTNDDFTDNNNSQNGNELQPLGIEASVLNPTTTPTGTRSIVYGTVFANLSQIGVHVAKGTADDADGNKGQVGTPYSDAYSNDMFHLDGSTWSPNLAYYLSADKGTVYAYYPFDSDARFTGGNAQIPVQILPTGSITVKDGISASNGVNAAGAITAAPASENDYMYYKPAGTREVVNNRAHTAQLTMQHALAQISFRMIKSSYNGSALFTKYEISDKDGSALNRIVTSATSSQMSIDDGAITHTAPVKGEISRTITNYFAGTTTLNATIVSNLVFPVDAITEGDIKANFIVDGQDHVTSLPVTAGVSDKWEAGKNYLYTITLGGTGIEITSVTIADWTNVDAGEINIQ